MSTLMEVFGSDLDFNKYSAFEDALINLIVDLRQREFEKPRKTLKADADELLKVWVDLIGEEPARYEQMIADRLDLRKWGINDLNEFGPGSKSTRL